MNTIKKIKVENMTSARGNREVPNQFIIHTEDGTYFQSYKSIIAFRPKPHDEARCVNSVPCFDCEHPARVTLDETYWNYSTTTGKYRNIFLGESIEETRSKIENGEYKLEDLNK